MAQNFNALVSGTTTFGALYGILNNNQEALRTCFSGTTFPANPTTPQLCVRTDVTPWRVYIHVGSDVWEDLTDFFPDFQALSSEIVAARGDAAALNTRLSVSINPDGTLKGAAPVGDWWMTEADAVAYASATTFTVAGDKTAIYTVRRAVYLTQTTPTYTHVVSASYDGGGDETTVTVKSSVVEADLSAVEYGQPPANSPRISAEDVDDLGTAATKDVGLAATNILQADQAEVEIATDAGGTVALGSSSQRLAFTGAEHTTAFSGMVAGVHRFCRVVTGGWDLTHHGTNLIVTQTGATILTAAGDTFEIQPLSATTCRIINYVLASGEALVGSGKILQVVSAIKTDTSVLSPGTTWTTIPGLSLNITPSSATSKILLFGAVNGDVSNSDILWSFHRGATPVGVGDSAGSRISSTSPSFYRSGTTGSTYRVGLANNYEDAPATTDELTYTIRARTSTGGGAFYANRGYDDTDGAGSFRMISSLIAMEVST